MTGASDRSARRATRSRRRGATASSSTGRDREPYARDGRPSSASGRSTTTRSPTSSIGSTGRRSSRRGSSAGPIPRSSTTRRWASAARDLHRDALALLARIVDERLLTAKAAFGFWPANTVGDDIELYADESRTEVAAVVHTLRQQMVKPPGRPNLALADFTAPKETGVEDYVGAFAVTAGHRLESLVAEFEAAHDDYSSILAKALADRLAEAFAERLHELVRREFWGYSPDERLPNDAVIREEYQGIRPAPGYPACPDHTEKGTLFELLEAEQRAGISLTESFAMWPGAAVSGYYFWHPQAHYFGLGRIGKDQLADYAAAQGHRPRDDGPLAGPEPGRRLGAVRRRPNSFIASIMTSARIPKAVAHASRISGVNPSPRPTARVSSSAWPAVSKWRASTPYELWRRPSAWTAGTIDSRLSMLLTTTASVCMRFFRCAAMSVWANMGFSDGSSSKRRS